MGGSPRVCGSEHASVVYIDGPANQPTICICECTKRSPHYCRTRRTAVCVVVRSTYLEDELVDAALNGGHVESLLLHALPPRAKAPPRPNAVYTLLLVKVRVGDVEALVAQVHVDVLDV